MLLQGLFVFPCHQKYNLEFHNIALGFVSQTALLFYLFCLYYLSVSLSLSIYIHINIYEHIYIYIYVEGCWRIFARKNFYQDKRVKLQSEIWKGAVNLPMKSKRRGFAKSWKFVSPRRQEVKFQSLERRDWKSCSSGGSRDNGLLWAQKMI